MDFDLSKENIQPLRGGRNASQLEVALQAQNNEDFQRELLQQKEEFERAIRAYEGDDPLENWYHYISWVEQSYPKHGHEGNFVNLLEDCLTKFEEDSRYTNDIRFCKLWIKYNDLQQNPLELYHMMHSRGMFRGCAELYKAWAYYHEAVGDFRNADIVFQLGKRDLAQPYEELVIAHENMIYAAGQQLISGVNEQRLMQQRQALTTLRTYKPGRVGSVRTASASGPGTLPASGATGSRFNAVVPVYEDKGEAARGAEATRFSILSVARRQVAPKENTIKPGTWTSAGPLLKGATHRTPKFTVHEDADDKPQGLRLPKDYYPVTHEDFSHWKPMLCYAEPEDPSRIPMYPKAKVYSSSETEYSIEEIRACRYLRNRLNISHVETEQAIQSILGDKDSHIDGHLYAEQPEVQCVPVNITLYQDSISIQNDVYPQPCEVVYSASLQPNLAQSAMVLTSSQLHQSQMEHFPHFSSFSPDQQQQNVLYSQHMQQTSQPSVVQHSMQNSSQHQNQSCPRIFGQHLMEPASFQNASPSSSNKSMRSQGNTVDDNINFLWRSHDDSLSDSIQQLPKANVSKFVIFEESHLEHNMQPKGKAMKTEPLKILSDEELAETGSRGGHDIAAAAQPSDEAKRIEFLEDDSSSSFPEVVAPATVCSELNATCNTQIFNFNLNVMQVSTPEPNQQNVRPNNNTIDEARKQLFTSTADKKMMSPIPEETKSYESSSSGNHTTMKSTMSSNVKKELSVLNSSYHFNLAQNLKANAALRTSLSELMECESGQSSPVTEVPVAPLEQAPSDPFKPALLRMLLAHVGFPNRCASGFVKINAAPRIQIRKETTFIGEDPYLVDRMLGKGTYGQVYKATDLRTNKTVALKSQKPPNYWEFYICRELQARLAKHPLRDSFMDVQIGYFHESVSVFVSEFSPCGSLLELANNFRQKAGYPLRQGPCVYLCIQMLNIVFAMHEVKIIHADIKPDNFLVYVLSDGSLQLQLIDFGCSIDMTLFPPGSSFTRRVTTKDFICPEMQEGRPWNYHTDLFCVAATAHVLLFDKYMQLQKKGDQWSITQRFPRTMRVDVWNTFFSALLNQQKGIADAQHLSYFLNEALTSFQDVNTEMRKLVNILNNR